MRFVLVVGSTRTAEIDGISAAGMDPAATYHTPAADVEIVEFGRPVRAPSVPVSPTGCPTPAVVTRAVRELIGFETAVLDAGLAVPTAAPAVAVGAGPGEDVRERTPLPDAEDRHGAAREWGRELPAGELVVGESVPGGTTTALGVLRALGEPHDVSSSLADNPVELKRRIVEEGLASSDLAFGDAAGDPLLALRAMGDPVLAAVAGLVAGAAETGTDVTLAGGTQMLAAAALLRHGGIDTRFRLATTAAVAADETADLRSGARALDLDAAVVDPGFDRWGHEGLARYARGEGKEGVGMGGALWLAEQVGLPPGTVRDRAVGLYESLLAGRDTGQGARDRPDGTVGDDGP